MMSSDPFTPFSSAGIWSLRPISLDATVHFTKYPMYSFQFAASEGIIQKQLSNFQLSTVKRTHFYEANK